MTNDMIQLLVNTDQNLLLYLNGFHNAFGDYFMSTFTGNGFGYRCMPVSCMFC